MSEDKLYSRREFIFGAGSAAILGGAIGYLLGRGGHVPAVSGYPFKISIQGGYGIWFKKTAGKTTMTLMSLKSASCTDQSQFFDHKMLLIVPKDEVDVDTSGSNLAPVDDGAGLLYWALEGPTQFTSGMAGAGITEGPSTPAASLMDPFGPPKPRRDSSWNDQVWLAGREKAKDDPLSLTARYIELTDGGLTIHRPANELAQVGRWVFNDKGTGKTQKRALTDMLELDGISTESIALTTNGKPIVFKARNPWLDIAIRHELDPAPVTFDEGQPPPHFAMLFDFVKDRSCDTATVPTYEKRTDVTLAGSPTPGDFCPPLMLE